MSSFTPGPWIIENGHRPMIRTSYLYKDHDGNPKHNDTACICDMMLDCPQEEVQSNARLISAAPELLDACKEACIMLKQIAKEHGVSVLESPGFMRIYNAIQKASPKSND